MRHISSFDWKEFFESVSLVDQRLRSQSAFASMDFKTRDRYATRSRTCRAARAAASWTWPWRPCAWPQVRGRGRGSGHDRAAADPGYWLISKGRRALEARLGYRPSPTRRMVQLYVWSGLVGYAGGILLVSVALGALPLAEAVRGGSSTAVCVVIALLGILTATRAAGRSSTASSPACSGPLAPQAGSRARPSAALRTLIAVPRC
jgi:cyclic beta-1,2-glucan synthetase